MYKSVKMLLLSSEDVRTLTELSVLSLPPPVIIYCCLLSRSSGCCFFFFFFFLEEKNNNSGYLPRYVTDDGDVLQHSDCKWIMIVVVLTVNRQLSSNTRRPYFLVNVTPMNGILDANRPRHSSSDLYWLTLTSLPWGAYIEIIKYMLENKPLPSLVHVYCCLFSGGYVSCVNYIS